MKKVLQAIIILFISLNLYAQTFEGIGDFRIGMSFSDFKVWANSKQLPIIQMNTWQAVSLRGSSSGMWIYEPVHNMNKPENTPKDVNYVDGVTVLILNSYSVSDINIDRLKFTFLNDVLINIYSEFSNELEFALTAKYGNPRVESSSSSITCRSNFTGVSVTKSETMKRMYWRNDVIIAMGYDSSYYSNSCDLLKKRFLHISDEEKYLKYYRQNERGQITFAEDLKNKKMNELKNKLGDL